MGWISLSAHRCSISKIPTVTQRSAFGIRRGIAGELHGQRTWTIESICGSNSPGRIIATVRDFANSVENIDIIKGAVERMRGEANNTLRPRREITDTDELVIRVESEVTNPSDPKIGMKVGILV